MKLVIVGMIIGGAAMGFVETRAAFEGVTGMDKADAEYGAKLSTCVQAQRIKNGVHGLTPDYILDACGYVKPDYRQPESKAKKYGQKALAFALDKLL